MSQFLSLDIWDWGDGRLTELYTLYFVAGCNAYIAPGTTQTVISIN